MSGPFRCAVATRRLPGSRAGGRSLAPWCRAADAVERLAGLAAQPRLPRRCDLAHAARDLRNLIEELEAQTARRGTVLEVAPRMGALTFRLGRAALRGRCPRIGRASNGCCLGALRPHTPGHYA